MEPTFRKSMAWLHTWAGVVIGSLLFAIFWMGSLSVFDHEIDRWMMPATRLSASADHAPVRLDGALTDNALALTRGSAQWLMRLPSDRVPAVELRWRTGDGGTERRYLDPSSAQVLAHTGTPGGTGFIFPFHYSLHLKWKDLGYWLVGLAGMTMLVMLVSGVIIHRRILADFFLFRPKKQLQRSSLDLHNLSGVLALPLHFGIALSGLISFFSVYWPGTYQAAYPEAKEPRQAFSAEGLGQYRRAKAQAPGTLGSLDAMIAAAEQGWPGGRADFVRVWHPGDANSYVEIRRSHADAVTMNLDQVYFDAASGTVLHRFEARPLMTVQRFISGLHFIQFEHWALRWLYFVAGLSGCVMIATGHLFWLASRRASHAKKGLAGVRVVEALTIGSVPGIIVATLAFFVANRLLPLNARHAGLDRAGLEMSVFYLVWLGSFVHAALRQRAAWREQAWAVAALALLAVALNWLTTGHHLPHALRHGLWGVAGMDALLLLGAALAAWSARRLSRRARGQHAPAGQDTHPAAHHA